MFIVLFDIDYSNDCRCHQYFIKFLFVCVLLIHCCGWIRAAESKTALPNIVSNENGASGISTVLSQTPANQQPKPSSVIYIPSMDGNKFLKKNSFRPIFFYCMHCSVFPFY